MRKLLKVLVFVALLAVAVWAASRAGPFLVVDRPEKSDALLILAGDENDVRLQRGEDLVRQGFAAHGFIDAVTQLREFGKTPAQHAADYLAQAPADIKTRITVCGMVADSTAEEFAAVRPCLENVAARKVLIVTSDFHTRRSLSVAKKVLPKYAWSVAAARTPVSQPYWWRSRWALRNVLIEYEKLIWWKLVDSHR